MAYSGSMNPFALLLGAFLSFLLGFLQHPAWLIPGALFALAWIIGRIRWLLS